MRKPLNNETAQVQNTSPERIIQFGGGNFLRAFVDWMVQELNDKADFDSSVVVVKPTPGGSYATLDSQDGLFHVQLHGLQDGELITRRKLITCVSRSVNPYEDYESFLALARQPDIRFIVSNTTEAGIAFVPEDKLDDAPPSSFPAKLTALLYERFKHFQGAVDKGCIILPCELIENNGQQLQLAMLQYAELWQLEPQFKIWLAARNLYCNTLVDRIVTGFPAENSETTLDDLGFDDQLLVEGEQYHSWVIQAPEWLQNEFPVQETDLNVKIVPDITLYRDMKVRILNGAHTSMVPLGYMLGLETVREAVEHKLLGKFIKDLIFKEAIPTLDLPKDELESFAEDVLTRFRNPFLHHRLLSIALNSTSKFQARLLPTLLDYAKSRQKLPERIVFAFAALIRFYEGTWQGEKIPLNDDTAVMQWFADLWHSGRPTGEIVAEVLKNESLWQQDLTPIHDLASRLCYYLDKIENDGVQHIIKTEKW